MYKLKQAMKRGSALAGAVSLLAGISTSALPSLVSADDLNPLTERSLTLSSSSPGWANTDGSGNSTYAPPNSGANGQKTGNYFSFKVSTNSAADADADGNPDNPIKAITFQYCTKSAGNCISPGNDSLASTPGTDDATHADLNVNYPSASEVGSGDFSTVVDSTSGLVKAVPGYTNNNPKYQSPSGGNGTGDPAEAAKNVAGNYVVMYKSGGTWLPSSGWTISTSNQEEAAGTGKKNTIILQNATGLGLATGTEMKVLFFARTNNYITNPGEGAFFVKINTFKNFQALTTSPSNTLADNIARKPSDIIDGGVTVANVMNQSIQITTKVLETMQFSVGTVDPDTLDSTQLAASEAGARIPCNPVLTRMSSSDPANVLQLGDQDSESSLATEHTYATHSYWRLSSNSSAGATVYYSGHTLSNTSGDEIEPIGTTAKASAPGSEQFGLAIDSVAYTGGHTFDDAPNGVDYRTAGIYENAADNTAAGVISANDTTAPHTNGQPMNGVDASVLTTLGATNAGSGDYTGLNASFHMPKLAPLAATNGTSLGTTDYGSGSGTITSAGTAKFAFDKMSDTVPAAIATENNQVVDCVTAKMRYIGNIAATTPAGIYTTKVNYIAAPQY